MGFIFIFLDGTGIGAKDVSNPFFAADPQTLRFWENSIPVIDNMNIKSIDPLLGVPGIPQSATGQTTIYTGVNTPGLLGQHKGSFPDRQMRKIIKDENILKKLNKLGKKSAFINAYPMHSKIFSSPNIEISDSGTLIFSENFPRKYKKRISVTTTMIVSNGTIPFDVEDMIKGKSLYQDFSNHSLIKLGLKIPEISSEKAGRILFNISKHYDLAIYEYFQTDIFGHRKSFEEKTRLISSLDIMVKSLIERSDPETDTILLTSDHGNIEDSYSKSHTKNRVPLLVWGKGRENLLNGIDSLDDITPGIIEFFS